MVETSIPYSEREKLGIFFWEDFTVAEQVCPEAVLGCYFKAFKESENIPKFLTELAVVLFRKAEHFSKNVSKKDIFSVYASLLEKVNDFACDKLKGSDLYVYAQALKMV